MQYTMCHKSDAMSCVHGKMKDFGLLALRLALGAIFIYAGYGKLGANHAMVSGMMGKLIGPESAGSFWAYFVGLAEVVGGAMLVLGVFASYAAAWLSIIMIVAILTVHLNGSFANMYAPLAILGGT
ncbi:MAG: DoxX family protein, partial [Candidatus Magasanikbacteria bacterium]|nr:DoxX family protein [Candidatus Magasanikbacteria bacterium]